MTTIKSEDAGAYKIHPLGNDDFTVKPYTLKPDDTIIEEALKILAGRVSRGQPLTKPDDVKNYLLLFYRSHEHEVFGCIFMNSQHEVITFEEMFQGTIDGASVYPREVVKRALELNAAAVTFYHNHPSGNPTPSQADIRLTGLLKTALKTVDIRTLDHIVIGAADTRPVSFAEQGLI